LEEKYGDDIIQNEHVSNLQARLKLDLAFFNREIDEATDSNDNSLSGFQLIYLELLEQQRTMLDKINHKAEFDEELVRKYLSLIDMEEFKIREKMINSGSRS